MGVFEYEKVSPYLDKEYQTVVETGTCLGYSTSSLKNHFKQVHTIELNEELYHKAVEKFKNDKNVICHQGDSKQVLKELIPKLEGKVIFFLDAHWSGDNDVDWEKSNWKGYGVETSYCGDESTGQNQVPLLEEIELIVENFKGECLIYVDDADKFGWDGEGLKDKGFQGEDWSHISLQKLKKAVKGRELEFKVDSEQLVIKLSACPSED